MLPDMWYQQQFQSATGKLKLNYTIMKIGLYKPLLLTLLILLSGSGFAQKKYTNTDRANELKKKYDKANVIAFNATTSYEFKINGEQLNIFQYDQVDLISLESNIKYARPIFYNDHIQLSNTKVRYTSGRGSIKKEEICGNYEVESIFYSDAKVCVYKFNMLYEASEVTITSHKQYTDPRYLTKIFFHDQDPTEAREISFIIPNEVDVELREMNFKGFDIKKEEVSEGSGKKVTYKIENIDELKSEPNSLGLLYNYPHIIVVSKSYKLGNEQKNVLASVDDLYSWYHMLVSNVKNDPEVFKDKVAEITADAKTADEKIKAIYYWVQDNIKYIAFEDGIAGFKPEPAHQVYSNRYGDCKGMAILTKEMLKLAGFDARLTWIGTNRIPYNYDLPSLAVDNHMICTVYEGDVKYILDPTEKYIALGNHAERIQGKEMLIENGENYLRKVVPTEGVDKNLVTRQESLWLEGETIKGKGQLTINGEAKKSILYMSTNSIVKDRDKLFNYLAVPEYNNTDIVKVIKTSPVDRENPMTVEYDYALTNKITSFGNDIYINLDWNKTYGNLILDENRKSDYYFGRKVLMKMTKNLKVPKGYKVTHLPQGMRETTEDFSFNISFSKKGNEIIYNNEMTFVNGVIEKEKFDLWNEHIKKLKEIYNDQIVLTKIQ